MTLNRRIVLCAGLALCLGGAAMAETPEQEPIAAASRAARQWLALTDTQQYQASWDGAAAPFQEAGPKQVWDAALQAVRTPLGAVSRRTQRSATYTTTLPGAPDGQYVVIVYQTDFANKAGAIETITPMRAPDGSWKVSGYFIK